MIEHPSHYTKGKIECIDVIEDQDMNYNEGNALKYLWRYKSKGKPLEDLLKCLWYLNRLIHSVCGDKRKKVVYISGKYSDDTKDKINQNIILARNESVKWWEKGYAVICPHMNTCHFERFIDDYNMYIDGDEEIVRRCDILVVLPNWRESPGTQREIKVAEKYGKKIVYV